MYTQYDLDDIMWKMLRGCGISDIISGGIYREEERPVNSDKEDVCINTIAITTTSVPQVATSNVNVYVPDRQVKVKGVTTYMPNTPRLKELCGIAINAIRYANIEHLSITPTNQATIAEPDRKQHYVNIRVDWNIQVR